MQQSETKDVIQWNTQDAMIVSMQVLTVAKNHVIAARKKAEIEYFGEFRYQEVV